MHTVQRSVSPALNWIQWKYTVIILMYPLHIERILLRFTFIQIVPGECHYFLSNNIIWFQMIANISQWDEQKKSKSKNAVRWGKTWTEWAQMGVNESSSTSSIELLAYFHCAIFENDARYWRVFDVAVVVVVFCKYDCTLFIVHPY